jgi:ribosomal protein S18 acetylase RimI-like enzyme
VTSPTPDIRLLTAADAQVLSRVDEDVFDQPVKPELVRAFLANPANLLAVAVQEGMVIGMASAIAYVHPDKPLQLFINEVGVAAHAHRRGIGKRLVRALLERGKDLGCAEAWVATEVENTAARALYASLRGREDEKRAVVYTFDLSD